jgi:hypothetical protein
MDTCGSQPLLKIQDFVRRKVTLHDYSFELRATEPISLAVEIVD